MHSGRRLAARSVVVAFLVLATSCSPYNDRNPVWVTSVSATRVCLAWTHGPKTEPTAGCFDPREMDGAAPYEVGDCVRGEFAPESSRILSVEPSTRAACRREAAS